MCTPLFFKTQIQNPIPLFYGRLAEYTLGFGDRLQISNKTKFLLFISRITASFFIPLFTPSAII